MFRGVNITKNNNLEINALLYKNKDEILAEIPLEFIKEVVYEFGKPTKMSLEIPKFIMRKEKKISSNLYHKMRLRQQIILEVEGKKERFIITDTSSSLEKFKGTKSFTAYSFEKVLENKRISFSDTITRTLIKDELYVNDGILNEVEKVSGWKIGYVDPDAMLITEKANETVTENLFINFINEKVEKDKLIWEKSFTTDVGEDYAVNIQIDYHNLKTYDSTGRLLKTESLSNELKPLYTNTKKIQAYYYSDTGNRYGIRYLITLIDDVEVEQIHTFTNVNDFKITCDNINLIYETGRIVEGTRAKFISVEATNENILTFMEAMQEQFECVFEYDTINKIINCYSKKNIGEDKPIELSYDTNVISLEITPSSEVPNCLEVESSNEIGISDVNIYGGEKIWNYGYYIENDLLTDEIVEALNKYDELLELKQAEYITLKDSSTALYSKRTKYESEISSIEYRIKYYTNLLTAFISADETDSVQQENIKREIEALEVKLNECIRERLAVNEQIIGIEDSMKVISNEIKRENAELNGEKIFTELDLEILDECEYCSIYEDDYYVTSYGLYENAKKVLEEMIKPEVEFDIECGNLVKLIKNKIHNVVELGSFFMVNSDELEELGQDKVRFIGYTLIPSENKISNTTFTNKEFKTELLNIASNIGRKTTKSANTINSWQNIVEDAMLSNDFVGELVSNGLNLATSNINARTSRNLLDFGEYGAFFKDANDPTDGNQVYIGNNVIAISTDGFKSSEISMTGDGLIAKTLIGSIILGQKLCITSDLGQFYIGNMEEDEGFGLSITDDSQKQRIFLGTEVVDGVRIARLRLMDKTGREVCISEDGIISYSQFVVWDNLSKDFPMKIPYKSDEGVFSNKKIVMSLYFDKYRAFERGMSSGGKSELKTTSDGGSYSKSTSTSNGGYYSNTTTKTSSKSGYFSKNVDTKFVLAGQNNNDYIDTTDGGFYFSKVNHKHTVEVPLPEHSHDVEITVTVPEHSHGFSVNIPNHSHTLTMDTTHNHELEYAIHEQNSMCSNVRIYINDILVRSNINSDCDVDITNYININKKNNIRIETDTNGRLTVNFQNKIFQGW